MKFLTFCPENYDSKTIWNYSIQGPNIINLIKKFRLELAEIQYSGPCVLDFWHKTYCILYHELSTWTIYHIMLKARAIFCNLLEWYITHIFVDYIAYIFKLKTFPFLSPFFMGEFQGVIFLLFLLKCGNFLLKMKNFTVFMKLTCQNSTKIYFVLISDMLVLIFVDH